MPEHNHIDLVELPAADPSALRAARDFYASAFGWSFTEYGDGYTDTPGSGVTLGVNAIPDEHQQRSPLTVLYVADLEAARQAVADAGGTILHDVYAFPGGRRFHFVDPAGNELAAWSEDPGA
ncbi:Glyoxalase/bleomycin resistance protein/dioxygenase [Xylanimonas cellulosilytica DSM 15894]|uniref:Glyoxalase/bleomycin resistance protein/dioxygenase n=1 Tax=Xylanimonas cellulosilytica (strain DSM 15894 / JCM 12276 / CECT 5975 / KCTC 9989 / LMG 20990 / NBRC 107835 / XIL07) TaxID=446471 RepID=D1BSL5_XYLCX|nr:VOC family protein [Xylanimonas cellulosilytica]ACZ30707.1 Glyoxalase/bleomycin resistance protein/dioxygenase [Xylanimonas cellulosilytica DSM 15894]